ncbi:MAG: methyl-accepting chemotaxis protein, partial [Thermotogae bacterium]
MKTIRSKMLLLILVPIVVILVAVALIFQTQIKNSTVTLTEDMSLELAQKASDAVAEWIESIKKEVTLMADTDAVVNALKTGNWQDVIEDLKSKAAERSYIEMFFIAYPDGTYYSTTGSTGNVADRKYFMDIMQKGKSIVVSDALVSKATGANVFVVAAAVKDETGKTIGICAATVTLDTISEIAAGIKIGKTGYGWAADSTGLIIAHPDPNVLMKFNL